MVPLGDSGTLRDFIRRARGRVIANQVYEQVILALAAGFGGLILLLLLGTQIMDWYWPVLLAIAALGFGIYRLRGRIASSYETAQRVDARLELKDTLSTALFFHLHPEAGNSPREVRELQFEHAERLAATLDPSAAISWKTPRASYAAAALALVAFGMIGVRYGINHSLELQKPIAKFSFDTFQPGEEVAKAKQRDQERKLDQQFQQIGLALDDEANKPRQFEKPNETIQESPDGDKGTETTVSTEKRTERGDSGGDQKGQDEEKGSEASDAKQQASNGNDENSTGDQPGQKADKQESGQPQSQANQNENSSLMEKMRNALANMLSKMKMQPQTGQGQQTASTSKGSLQNGQQQRQDDRGKPQSEGQQGKQQGQPSSQAKGSQEGQGEQQAQPGEGQQGSQSSDKPSSQDSKTGMGKSDGNKDVKLAEQLKAMGQISEIIGKRSQSLTGEMMVEVPSGKQQLKTAYTQRNATHSESGGEIHRDEVPLALQQYVQQYFEEIRKTPATPKGAKPVGAAN
jgi:hypothetical protein